MKQEMTVKSTAADPTPVRVAEPTHLHPTAAALAGSMTPATVAVIIVSWNTRDILADCLESLERDMAAAPDLDVRTYVVDNASTDGTVEMVRSRFSWVRLTAGRENLGFAGGNNLAMAHTDEEYVLLLNPDTVIHKGALRELVLYLQENPACGATGSLLLNPDGTLQTSCYPEPTLAREFWRLFHLDRIRPFGIYKMKSWNRDAPREVDVVQGAALMVRRTVLDDVGFLDDGYFIYTEEVDLCYRIRQASWQIYWIPASVVVHLGGQSTRQVARPMFLHLYMSKVQYFRKHHGRAGAMAYKTIIFLATLPRLLAWPLAFFGDAETRRRRRATAGNYAALLAKLMTF